MSTNVDYLFNTWVCFPKVLNVGQMKYLFNLNVGQNDNNTKIVERVLSNNVYALTITQRLAEWFLFKGFHLMATIAF